MDEGVFDAKKDKRCSSGTPTGQDSVEKQEIQPQDPNTSASEKEMNKKI